MTRSWIPILALILALQGTAHAESIPLQGPGAVLPLQDRVGDPAVATMIERLLIGALSSEHSLAEIRNLRDALRRLRIRNANAASPDQLERLGEELRSEWFFSATLHQATVQPVPQITLSARVVRRGRSELAWAGFESASGLDSRGVLERGRIDDLLVLAGRVVERLVDDFTHIHGIVSTPRARPDLTRTGFLAGPPRFGELRTIAVVPFDAVTELDATIVAETVTDLAMALLHREGLGVVVPGLVNLIQRRHGTLRRGVIDAPTRSALWVDAAASHVLTGSVERYEIRGGGNEPEPRIALSARFIDARSGRIVWIDGQERRGWDRQRLFRTGRIYAAGALAEEIMNSILAGPFRQAAVDLPKVKP